jgi:predicted PurR-regulated permease PerM
MAKENKYLKDAFLNKTLKVLGIVLLSLAIIYLLTLFSDFIGTIWSAIWAVVVPFALAWMISLLIYPLVKMLEKRGVGPRFLSVMIVYTVSAVLIFLVLSVLAPLIIDQVQSFFANDYQSLVAYLSELLDSPILPPTTDGGTTTTVSEMLESFLGGVASSSVSVASAILSTSFTILTILFILPILLLFYLLDYEKINEYVAKFIPSKYSKEIGLLSYRVSNTLGAYLRGQLLLMVAIGTVSSIFYKLIGVDYFLLFGILVGLTNIIPYFGIILALIPVLVYSIIVGHPNPFLVIGVNVIVQFFEGNIFQPVIMSKQLEMNPLLITASLLFFGTLFGAIGVLFAVPLAATIRVFYNYYLEKREERMRSEEANAT